MLDLSSSKKITDARHWQSEINQLYHPTSDIEQDSQDIVYTCDNLNTTKFTPILLKEWFYLVKKDGFLVIDYLPNNICDWQELEENFYWLWKNKYEIIYHGPVTEVDLNQSSTKALNDFIKNKVTDTKIDKKTLLAAPTATHKYPATSQGRNRFICRKTASTKIEGDSIEKWSFGIITNGVRADWIENIINSIRKQRIPNYEIIICGTYFDRKENDCRYIPFNKRDDLGWITKKKNMICHNANFQNLCIIHDRMFFHDEWYSGIKKWGNCFETLAVPQLFIDTNERFGDWVCVKDFDITKCYDFFPLKGGYLEYYDWDNDIPGYAGITTIKKDILKNNGYNETVYWAQYDDILLHQDLSSKGYILRFNPDSITYSKTKSVVDFSWYHEYDPLKLGKLKNINLLMAISFYLLHILGIKRNSKIMSPFKSLLKKRKAIKTHQDKK